MAVDDQTKRRIDEWIAKNGRNEYGDPKGSVYAGGTPLYNEMTGRTVDKYDYILKKYPELRSGK
jgi:hypothetical protein